MWPDLLTDRNATYVKELRPFRRRGSSAESMFRIIGGGHHKTDHIYRRGYTLKGIADYFRFQYTGVSKMIAEAAEGRK